MYTSVDQVVSSDHSPVTAHFDLRCFYPPSEEDAAAAKQAPPPPIVPPPHFMQLRIGAVKSSSWNHATTSVLKAHVCRYGVWGPSTAHCHPGAWHTARCWYQPLHTRTFNPARLTTRVSCLSRKVKNALSWPETKIEFSCHQNGNSESCSFFTFQIHILATRWLWQLSGRLNWIQAYYYSSGAYRRQWKRPLFFLVVS